MTANIGTSAFSSTWVMEGLSLLAFVELHDEEAHGEQIRCTSRTQAAFDEGKMNGGGSAPPVAARDTALIQKGLRGLPGEAQPLRSAAVKNVRVLHRGDQGEASLHPRRFGVIRDPWARTMQSRQSDLIDAWKSSSCLPSRTPDAESTAHHFTVTFGQSRSGNDVSPPAAGHDNAQRQFPINTTTLGHTSRRAEETQPKDRPAVRVHTARSLEHGALRAQPNLSQSQHGVAAFSRFGELGKKGAQSSGAAMERTGIHVRMAPRIDVAHQAGLRPGFDLQSQTVFGECRDLCRADTRVWERDLRHNRSKG